MRPLYAASWNTLRKRGFSLHASRKYRTTTRLHNRNTHRGITAQSWWPRKAWMWEMRWWEASQFKEWKWRIWMSLSDRHCRKFFPIANSSRSMRRRQFKPRGNKPIAALRQISRWWSNSLEVISWSTSITYACAAIRIRWLSMLMTSGTLSSRWSLLRATGIRSLRRSAVLW